MAALRAARTIRDDQTVVIVSTGDGLKQPVVRAEETEGLPTVDPDLRAFEALGLNR